MLGIVYAAEEENDNGKKKNPLKHVWSNKFAQEN